MLAILNRKGSERKQGENAEAKRLHRDSVIWGQKRQIITFAILEFPSSAYKFTGFFLVCFPSLSVSYLLLISFCHYMLYAIEEDAIEEDACYSKGQR